MKLCKQLNADLFIADDKEARRVAKIMKVKTLGACGILIQACGQGLQFEDRVVLMDPTLFFLLIVED